MHVRHHISANVAARFEQRIRATGLEVRAIWHDGSSNAEALPPVVTEHLTPPYRSGIITFGDQRRTAWWVTTPENYAFVFPIRNARNSVSCHGILDVTGTGVLVFMPVVEGCLVRLLFNQSYALSAERLAGIAVRRQPFLRSIFAGLVGQPFGDFLDVMHPLFCDRIIELVPPLTPPPSSSPALSR